MNHLTRNDYAGALRLLSMLDSACGDATRLARAAVLALGDYVASELTTLSVCDLVVGHREVIGLAGGALGTEDMAAFDRHFFEHPLLRHHGFDGGLLTHRLSDAQSSRAFRRSALYVDYYRRIGLDQAVAVPLFVDKRTLVGIVLNRQGMDFSERDCERLELLRPHLAFLYSLSCRAGERAARRRGAPTPVPLPTPPEFTPVDLTPREREVLRWVAAGKVDSDIAVLLSISPRTVQKHLEHIYAKLGVETRTAAVMRAMTAPPKGPWSPAPRPVMWRSNLSQARRMRPTPLLEASQAGPNPLWPAPNC